MLWSIDTYKSVCQVCKSSLFFFFPLGLHFTFIKIGNLNSNFRKAKWDKTTTTNQVLVKALISSLLSQLAKPKTQILFYLFFCCCCCLIFHHCTAGNLIISTKKNDVLKSDFSISRYNSHLPCPPQNPAIHFQVTSSTVSTIEQYSPTKVISATFTELPKGLTWKSQQLTPRNFSLFFFHKTKGVFIH